MKPPVIVFFIIIGGCFISFANGANDRPRKSGNTVDIEIFGGAMCLHTTIFLRQQLLPAYKLFGPRLRIRYHPFGVRRYTNCEWTGSGFECTCQHGQRECDKSALQACVIENFPRTEDHIKLVSCIQGSAAFNTSVRECIENASAPKQIDCDRLIRCATGSLGQELVARHGTTQDRKAPGMSWVPWIMIGGIRDKEAERHLIKQLCSRYLKPRPSECKMYGFEPTEDI